MIYFAHSKKGVPEKDWEPLFTSSDPQNEGACKGGECSFCKGLEPLHGHLNKVAFWAGHFARQMLSDEKEGELFSNWARAAGLLHDLGKFSNEFQTYLKDENATRVDHSSKGAQQAIKALDVLGHFIAYGIAGHHSGLLDGRTNADNCQFARLKKDLPSIANCPDALLKAEKIALPNFIKVALGAPKKGAFTMSFFSRMIFSCLVDADFLATESFMSPEKVWQRNKIPQNALSLILKLLEKKIDKFGEPENEVNLQRAKVANDCCEASKKAPGIFTLTVPTGGGKTLSSLLFALKHALAHDQSRIIYVVPFTSIIEQNAKVIHDIIKPIETENFTPLIEHHSSFSLDENGNEARGLRLKLATENWDAPIVMTTAVQFYESLFAAKTSRARKLHNIANSVIVLDEAQTLPVDLLAPCLRALEELAENYHSTIVLCTATQPAINDKDEFPIGFRQTSEIINDTKGLFGALKRVSIKDLGAINDEELAGELASRNQALCIVNRRQHAQELFDRLSQKTGKKVENEKENFHLSALMCPAHRSVILPKVRNRLEKGWPTRLISTQVIEAGVDIDFPIVYRALAGLDSIAQAAGRCNREGKLEKGEKGEVFVFKPEDTKGERFFRETAQIASQIIELKKEGKLKGDLLDEDAIRHYFDHYYYQQKSRWDGKKILEKFEVHCDNYEFPMSFNFASAAKDFKLIDEYQQPVIIPFDEKARKLIGELKDEKKPLNRELLRDLQKYTIQISPRIRDENRSAFESVRDDAFHILIELKPNYSLDFGLTFDEKYVSSQFYHS